MKQKFVAISGVKNSGKTTLIVKLIAQLTGLGLKVATIKHDGHDFRADVPDTDSYLHKSAGAYGTAVFSATKFMIVKDTDNCSAEFLAELFPEADLILLEGFKHSSYPKLEIVRKGISEAGVCDRDTLLGLVTDLPMESESVPVFGLNDVETLSKFLYDRVIKEKEKEAGNV